jgi:polyphosphate kinase
VGRFLEHSRIFHFANGGEEQYYIGSADWMPRNFLRRVEAVAPVEAVKLRGRLASLLRTCLADNRQAWELDAAGNYRQRKPTGAVRSTHQQLLLESWGQEPEPSPYAHSESVDVHTDSVVD